MASEKIPLSYKGHPLRRVVKKTEKDSLYTAMDVATVWLDRALSTK